MRALLSSLRTEGLLRTVSSARQSMRRSPATSPGADALSIELDANGSPVTIEASTWFICFVPGLRRQWWHLFAHSRHKHVFALRPLGNGTWLLVEPWWTRLMVNVLTLDQAVKFLRWGESGDILKVRESIPGRGSQMRGWSNCSVLVSFLLGRSYWTWTPNGLYRKLLRDADVESVDVPRLLRKHFLMEANTSANAALVTARVSHGQRLDEVLLDLGTRVFVAMTSTSAIGVHKAAVSESGRYGDAADAFWTFGPERAVERIRSVLFDAHVRSEARIDDCDVAARAFLGMLRSNFYLEIVFGIRSAPSLGEVREHVVSVVQVFLRGAWPTASVEADASMEARSAGLPAAHVLVQEIGASTRETVPGDDWHSVAGWAEVLWSEYTASTGLTWGQVSGRVRQAWESYGTASIARSTDT